MSREILFKAKRVDTGEWVEGYYCIYPIIRFPGDCVIITNSGHELKYIEVIPETVSQFTGKIDDEKSNIFENQFVMLDCGEEEWIALVEWNNDECRFRLNIEGEILDFVEFNSRDIKIIGNIFDNPELLEVTK